MKKKLYEVNWFMLIVAFSIVVVMGACNKEEPKEILYFKDLQPPLGIKANVVSDVSLNSKIGTSITVEAVVDPDLDRDELDTLMQSFYRQAKNRDGFRNNMPDRIDLRFYDNEAKAKAKGEDWIGRVLRLTSKDEPDYTNRQKFPFLKWAKKAIGEQPQYTGKLQIEIVIDPGPSDLQITVPFVGEDGKGEYVEEVSYSRATTTFSLYVRTLFDKISQLQKLTFIGKHKDQVIMKIWMTRQQYLDLDLREVEEKVSAFHGMKIPELMSQKISEKKLQRETDKVRHKVYREAFSKLPKEQIELAKALK